jgi:hypothetical protein
VQRLFFKFSIPFILFFLVINCGCTKIDTTTLGSDLVPAVDNVSTFADTLNVNGTQGFFNDSTVINGIDDHVMGAITNDPIFGTTKADIFVELKPGFFPFFFGSVGDTVDRIVHPAPNTSGFDSAVLCLSFTGFYGDTTKPHHFSVYKIDNSSSNFKDTSRYLNFQPNGLLTRISQSTPILSASLRDYTYIPGSKLDSVKNQIRIKLDDAFLSDLIANLDTSVSGSGNNIYRSDSIFKSFFRGFAIKSDETPGTKVNGLFNVNFNTTNTRLEIHYKRRKNNVVDTAFSSFYFLSASNSTITGSAHGNYFNRDYSVAEIKTSPQSDALYLQTGPGTFATLKIPALSTIPNSIVHRAELIIEQIPSSTQANIDIDNQLTPPPFLFLDLVDSSIGNGFKPIYHDLNPGANYLPDNNLYFFPTGGVDYAYFGGYLNKRIDVAGNAIQFYNFNISRYVQNMITRKDRNYTLRLYAPHTLHYFDLSLPFKNSLGNGRVKVGNGSNSNYKLKMRIVYSKI